MVATNLITDFNNQNWCSSFFFIKFADKYNATHLRFYNIIKLFHNISGDERNRF